MNKLYEQLLFNAYFEKVCEKMSDNFFYENEDWIMESELCNNWVEKLRDKGKEPEETAHIIERAFNIFAKDIDV